MMGSGDKADGATAASSCPACLTQCPWWHWISFNGRGEPPGCPAFEGCFDPPDHEHGMWLELLDSVDVHELVLDLPSGLDLRGFEDVTVRLWAEIEWSVDRRWRACIEVTMEREEKECVGSHVTVGDFFDARTAIEQSKRTAKALHRKIDKRVNGVLRRAVKRYERIRRLLGDSGAELQAWVKSLDTQDKP